MTLERRAHPRVQHRAPVGVVADGADLPIRCETVDISLGGMRLTSTEPIPVGACTVQFGDVALVGSVLGQIIDAERGLIISRVKFADVPPVAHDRIAAITGTAAEAPSAVVGIAAPSRRLYAGIAAAVLVIAVVVAALVARSGSDDADSTSLASSASSASDESSEEPSGSDDVDPVTPTTAVPEEPAAEVEPTTDPAPAVDPAPPAADPAPAPAPALVTRTETADNGVRVELSEDPSQTAVASSVGPSDGVDTVRIQLDVIPEQQGTVLPVALVIENRGEGTLEFPDGLTSTITVTAADGSTREVVLRAADVTSLAAGARHELLGSIDFGSYGDFEVGAVTPVAERA